jgi:hypothetical protein
MPAAGGLSHASMAQKGNSAVPQAASLNHTAGGRRLFPLDRSFRDGRPLFLHQRKFPCSIAFTPSSAPETRSSGARFWFSLGRYVQISKRAPGVRFRLRSELKSRTLLFNPKELERDADTFCALCHVSICGDNCCFQGRSNSQMQRVERAQRPLHLS